MPDRRWCKSCASYMKEARDRHREKTAKKPPGTCSRTDCTNPAAQGMTSCEACRARETSYEKRAHSSIQYNARQVRKYLRMRVFNAYGGAACACCGDDHYEFLTIDHVQGNGAEHRRSIGNVDIYRWLERNSYPAGFRVLCMNCNYALGKHGYCPHSGLTQPCTNGLSGKKRRRTP